VELLGLELRKAQETGGGTLLISLPKRWAERNNIHKGSLLSIEERADGYLILGSSYEPEKAGELAIKYPSSMIIREITEGYLLGYDSLVIQANKRISPVDRERIRQTVRRFIGLEIMEEDASRMVIQCLLEPSSLLLDKILRREHIISSSMHQDALTSVVEKDMHLARVVGERDEEVDRLYFLIVRVLRSAVQNPSLAEKLRISPIDCLDYRLAAKSMETIGDCSTDIAEVAIRMARTEMPPKIRETLLELNRTVSEVHGKAFDALIGKNIKLADAATEERRKSLTLLRELDRATAQQCSELIPFLSSLISNISKISDAAGDIADLVPVTG